MRFWACKDSNTAKFIKYMLFLAIILVALIGFITVFSGFFISCIVYFFNKDIESLKNTWIFISFVLNVLFIFWLVGLFI